MKVGIRKPSIKKSIKARTTGKIKRKVKKSVNPLYGKKGMGLINNPKKAIYNKVYNKTTIDATKPIKDALKTNTKASKVKTATTNNEVKSNRSNNSMQGLLFILFSWTINPIVGLIVTIIGALVLYTNVNRGN